MIIINNIKEKNMNNTTEEYLNELMISKSLSKDIPDHKLITDAEKLLDNEDKQRFQLFIWYTYTLRKQYILAPYKEKKHEVLEKYEMIIYSNLIYTLLTNVKSTRNNILDICKTLNIIVPHRFIVVDNFASPVTIYKFNPEILNCSTKTLTIDHPRVLNSNYTYLFDSYSALKQEHKNIINCNINKIYLHISKEEFNTKYYNQKLDEHINGPIITEYSKNNDKFPTREEYVDKFIKKSEALYLKIENINSENRYLRFLECFEDEYGHRFFHPFLSIPKQFRWNFTMNKINPLIPLFECDMVAAQPTMTAIQMDERGFYDEKFFNDINNMQPDYYESLSKYFDNCSRDEAKTYNMKFLFDDVTSKTFEKLLDVYPETCKFLSIQKNRTADEIELEDGVLPGSFHYRSSNCISMQRKESKWANALWCDLYRRKIRFIPIHDSVIIFGKPETTKEEAEKLSKLVEHLMMYHLKLRVDTKVIPHFKTKLNPKFSVQEEVNIVE
jgi:hypothetical protein